MSRSGSTIAIGMLLGLRRDAAARFTFLLAIPAMVAAGAKEALELREIGLSGDDLLVMIVGGVVSAVVGYLTIKYFLRYLARHRLDVFAYYRWALAAATAVWLWRRRRGSRKPISVRGSASARASRRAADERQRVSV